MVPEYLREIVSSRRENVSKYCICNRNQYDTPRCKLGEFNPSFVPDAVRKWSPLNAEAKKTSSIDIFCNTLSSKDSNPSHILHLVLVTVMHDCIFINHTVS